MHHKFVLSWAKFVPHGIRGAVGGSFTAQSPSSCAQSGLIHSLSGSLYFSFLARALKGLPFSFFISHSVFVCICIPSSSFALCLFLRCQKFATLLPKWKGVEAIHSLPPLTSPLLSAPFYFAIFQYAPYQPTIRPRHLPPNPLPMPNACASPTTQSRIFAYSS